MVSVYNKLFRLASAYSQFFSFLAFITQKTGSFFVVSPLFLILRHFSSTHHIKLSATHQSQLFLFLL